ncbi:TetR family transcriptional regulator [Methylacidimicrobium sp. AP8]|uniref:TetR/AcrR family transcriptional regulator n=1 Tax=Methylacidimicrobium sp. AP8 TaxID=2730359 RepID=UPI0018C1ADA3|nr:TetR/AcrR family transcriptional regulator [Methylacidimicrobium sp. AP8]CAB4242979.1 TetR family transcriptional regulator [Methylacidimicrobium sp. AP8]
MSTSLQPARASSTRDKIIAAATALFAARGFKGTTTRRIAVLARVNEALIYRHFPSKEALYAAIIEKKIAKLAPLLDRLRCAAETGERPQVVLREIARQMFASVDEDPQFLRLFYFSGLEGHSLSRMFFEAYSETFYRNLSGYILSRIREGVFRPIDPNLAARAFAGIVLHHLVVQTIFPEAGRFADREQAIDTFVDIFVQGILRHPDGDRTESGPARLPFAE